MPELICIQIGSVNGLSPIPRILFGYEDVKPDHSSDDVNEEIETVTEEIFADANINKDNAEEIIKRGEEYKSLEK